PGDVVTLRAGDELVVARESDGVSPPLEPTAPEPTAPEPTAPEPTALPPVLEPEPAEPEPPRAERTDPADSGRAWRALANRGRHHEAYAALRDRGIARESEHASPEQLLLLADVARLSGHPAEAVRPLERLITVHPT